MMLELKDKRGDYPAQYTDLLDDEIWHFINETDRWYPPDAVEWPIEKQRETYNALCDAFTFSRPDGMKTEDEGLHHKGRTVGLRHYQPAHAHAEGRIIYIHGGGFVVGGLDSHDSICADLSHATGLPLTAIDYALAPEHNFPADYEDCLFAFETLAARFQTPLVLVGDSAGANLCASVSQTARHGAVQAVGQVLIYPGLNSSIDHGSFIEHAHAPGLTQADTRFYKHTRVGGDLELLKQPHCCPLNETDGSGLPITHIHTADCDPLRDDGPDYVTFIQGAGGKASNTNWEGLIHGHLRARHSSKKAAACFEAIVTDVKTLIRL